MDSETRGKLNSNGNIENSDVHFFFTMELGTLENWELGAIQCRDLFHMRPYQGHGELIKIRTSDFTQVPTLSFAPLHLNSV
jgi:hypothetical protein